MIDEELLQKVKRVFSDEINLLGNFHFDEEEIEELRDEFVLAAKRNSNSFNYSSDEIAFFVIVVVNKLRDWDKEWSENGFWDQINQVFDDDYFIYLLLKQFLIKLYDAIDSLFKKYNRVLFRTKGNKRAFAQTFLYHALAPRFSLESFVDLAWRKYFDDLECDYPSSDLVFCEYVINSLKKKIVSPDEDTDVQFGSTYYRLRTAFKYGVVQNTEKTIKLLDNILLSINKVDRNSEDLEENTINRIISSVVAKNKRVIVRTGNGGGVIYKGANTAHTFNQLRPVLNIDFAQHDRPTIFIRVPRLILLGSENECAYVDVYLYRENDDGSKVLLKQFSRRWIKNNGEHSYTMSAFSEELTDIYFNEQEHYHYEFRIVANSGDGYSSKKEFYRDFLLFNSDKEVRGNTKPGNYYIVVPQKFDPFNNLHLLKADYRLLWKNIYNIVPEDFDSIEYRETDVLFSQQGMPSNVAFEDQELSPVEGIEVFKNEETYEVFKNFSNLLINKDDDTNVEAIRIHHVFKDVYGNTIIDNEKRLSELPLINHRYIYNEVENSLSEPGYHSLVVTKISKTVLANKNLLDRRYVIDPEIKFHMNCIPYLNGDDSGRVKLLGIWADFDIGSTSEFSECFSEELDAYITIRNPFFSWYFGSSMNNVHYSQVNIKRPIIITEFESTNETVVINTSLQAGPLLFKDSLRPTAIEVFAGNEENTYLLSQFINAGHKKGYFFCLVGDKEIPLFSITDRPYGADSVDLGDCLLLEDNTFKADIREYFIHDNLNYNVYLYLKDERGKRIKFKLKNDEENVFENTSLDDGEYEANVAYAKIYIGDEEPEVSLPSFDVVLGDINKKAFVDIERIDIKPPRNFATGAKLKMDGYFIDSISYFGYDPVGDCVFNGMLKSKTSKPQKIRFTHKDGCLIKNLLFVYGKDDEILKKANFDTTKNCFTTNPVSDTVAEFKTIYYK